MIVRTVGLAALVSLAGCFGLGSQRPVGNALKAPDHWKEFPVPMRVSVNPLIGIWTPESSKDGLGKGQFIMLMRFPSSNKWDAAKIMQSSGAKDGEILNSKNVTLCNGAQGVAMQLKGTQTVAGSAAKPMLMNVTMGKGINETLIAIYSRPADAPADSAAVSAVGNLCPILNTKQT